VGSERQTASYAQALAARHYLLEGTALKYITVNFDVLFKIWNKSE